MPFNRSMILVLTLAAAGCFPREAPHRPVTARSLAAVKDPAKIEFLDFHDTTNATLPDTPGVFTNLTRLSLRNSGLQTLPASVSGFTNLSWLDLGENQLTVFPDPTLIPNVEFLWLSDNAISEITPDIAKLDKLTYLNLDRNQLKALPPEMGGLKLLRFLRLNGNKLETLPETLGQLKNLKRLYIKGNPLPAEEKQKLKKLLPGVDIIE